MDFRIRGLAPAPYAHLFGLSDHALDALGIKRCLVDQTPGYPDRIELRDAAVGETVLLLNHVSQPAPTPYRASHAIYVREGASQTYDAINQVPESLRIRLLSLRAFADDGMMLQADVIEGSELETMIATMLGNPAVAYIHAHNARRGCYAARIDRA